MANDVPRIAASTIVQMCAQVRNELTEQSERLSTFPRFAERSVADEMFEMVEQMNTMATMVGALARVVQEQ